MKCRSAQVRPGCLLPVEKNAASPQQWALWREVKREQGEEKQVFRDSSLDPPESGFLTFLCLSDPLVSFKLSNLFLAALGPGCRVGSSLAVASRGGSLCACRLPRRAASPVAEQGSGHVGSVAAILGSRRRLRIRDACHGLHCSVACGRSFRIRDETCVYFIGRQILYR